MNRSLEARAANPEQAGCDLRIDGIPCFSWAHESPIPFSQTNSKIVADRIKKKYMNTPALIALDGLQRDYQDDLAIHLGEKYSHIVPIMSAVSDTRSTLLGGDFVTQYGYKLQSQDNLKNIAIVGTVALCAYGISIRMATRKHIDRRRFLKYAGAAVLSTALAYEGTQLRKLAKADALQACDYDNLIHYADIGTTDPESTDMTLRNAILAKKINTFPSREKQRRSIPGPLEKGMVLGISHFESNVLADTNVILGKNMHDVVDMIMSREAAFLTQLGTSRDDMVKPLTELYLNVCGSKLFRTGVGNNGTTFYEAIGLPDHTDSLYIHPELATVPKGMGVDEYAKAVWIPSGETILQAAESVK